MNFCTKSGEAAAADHEEAVQQTGDGPSADSGAHDCDMSWQDAAVAGSSATMGMVSAGQSSTEERQVPTRQSSLPGMRAVHETARGSSLATATSVTTRRSIADTGASLFNRTDKERLTDGRPDASVSSVQSEGTSVCSPRSMLSPKPAAGSSVASRRSVVVAGRGAGALARGPSGMEEDALKWALPVASLTSGKRSGGGVARKDRKVKRRRAKDAPAGMRRSGSEKATVSPSARAIAVGGKSSKAARGCGKSMAALRQGTPSDSRARRFVRRSSASLGAKDDGLALKARQGGSHVAVTAVGSIGYMEKESAPRGGSSGLTVCDWLRRTSGTDTLYTLSASICR
mmetsp:Transcript_8627/g.27512  ORF Transcript_8627/g.27512 Transcript_8627/m.27512 type:complete len:343 (+) Transcript_8627:349-1377(+)